MILRYEHNVENLFLFEKFCQCFLEDGTHVFDNVLQTQLVNKAHRLPLLTACSIGLLFYQWVLGVTSANSHSLAISDHMRKLIR